MEYQLMAKMKGEEEGVLKDSLRPSDIFYINPTR